MLEHQFHPAIGSTHKTRHALLQQHPVLFPLLLIAGSTLLILTSFSAETLFPILALLELPLVPLCLSIAFALGISGILISIISVIEHVDRRALP